jgi:hypothetical protein
MLLPNPKRKLQLYSYNKKIYRYEDLQPIGYPFMFLAKDLWTGIDLIDKRQNKNILYEKMKKKNLFYNNIFFFSFE